MHTKQRLSRSEKQFWFRYFRITNHNKIPESLNWFGAPDSEYTDDDIDCLTLRVQQIDTLILGGSWVTVDGLSYLPRLQYLRRLDLKDLKLGDDCLPYLQKLTTLEDLHIGHNNISLEGIQQLSVLPKLQVLICSVPLVTKEIEEKLNATLPNCELTICGPVEHGGMNFD